MKFIIATFLSSLTLAVAAQGYVKSSDGNFVRDGSGQCVRTGTWTESDRNAECDGVKKPVSNKITLRSDILFGFDKSDLTKEGKTELDKMVTSLPTTGLIVVTGYADQIGNSEYNQKLSERRAAAVAKYLSGKTNAKFQVAGMGSRSPLPGTELCAGMKNWQRKVACYAPNRRVEVDYINK
jgi:outer membrane protein OmpA-like peptidoglycan-associated protein